NGANGGLASNYSLASATALGSITAKALTIGSPTIASRVYNGTTAAGGVTVGALSGLVGTETLTVTAVASAYASANVGTYSTTVTYTLGNGTGLASNYSLASGTRSGSITAKALTVGAPSIASRAYNGTTAPGGVTVGALSGLVGTETLTVTGVASAYSGANVGTYSTTVTYTLADGANGGLASNYSLAAGTASGSITAKSLTISASTIYKSPSASLGWTPYYLQNSASPYSLRTSGYGSGFSYYQKVTGATTGAIWGTGIYTDDSQVATAAVHIGLVAPGSTINVQITLTGWGNNFVGSIRNGVSSYSWLSYYGGSYQLTRAPDQSYSTTSTSEFSAAGLVGSETVGSVKLTVAEGNDANSPTGTYAITPSSASGGTFNPANYQITYATGSLIVGNVPVPVLTWASQTGSYGDTGTVATPTATVNGSPVAGTFVYSSGTPSVVSLSGSIGSTYTALALGSSTLTATFTPNDPTAVQTGKTVSTTFAVTTKQLMVTGISIDNKFYDGTATATIAGVAAYSGLAAGDRFPVIGTPAALFTSKDVGVGKPVTVSGYSAPSSNYTVVQPTHLTASITPRSLNVVTTIASRPYDGSAASGAVILGTLSGLVGSETLTVTGAASAYASANVGTYTSTVTYTLGNGANGGLASNYSLASATALGSITAKALTIGAPSIASRSYDGTIAAAGVVVGTLSGLVGSETLTVTGAASAYASANVGTYSSTVTYALADGTQGGLASNYSLGVSMATGVVTPRKLAITPPSIAPKVYDGSTSPGVVTLGAVSGWVGSETVGITGTASSYASAAIGTYSTVVTYLLADGDNGGLATNYSLEATPASGSIVQPSIQLAGTTSNPIDSGAGLDVSVNGNVTMDGVLSGAGPVNITFGSASGRLTINSQSTHTGPMTISGGTVVLGPTGSLSTSGAIQLGVGGVLDVRSVSNFTLGSGQTLGGVGTVVGSPTVLGTLSPGASPGILAVDGDLVMGGGSVLRMDLAANAAGGRGTQHDSITVTGSVAFASTVVLRVVLNGPGSEASFAHEFWNGSRLGNQGWLLYSAAAVSGVGNVAVEVSPDSSGSPFTRGLFFVSATNGDVYLNYAASPEVIVNAGNNQSGLIDATLPVAPSVLVRDVTGVPLGGVRVRFTAGNGSISPALVLSDSNGIATGGSWTLPGAAGSATLTADIPGSGSTLSASFTAAVSGQSFSIEVPGVLRLAVTDYSFNEGAPAGAPFATANGATLTLLQVGNLGPVTLGQVSLFGSAANVTGFDVSNLSVAVSGSVGTPDYRLLQFTSLTLTLTSLRASKSSGVWQVQTAEVALASSAVTLLPDQPGLSALLRDVGATLDIRSGDFSATGSASLVIDGFVMATGSLAVTRTTQSQVILDGLNGTVPSMELLVLGGTDLSLFVGSGAAASSGSLVVEGASGFFATAANVTVGVALARSGESTDNRRWVGIVASAASMDALGLPTDFAARARNVQVVSNLAFGGTGSPPVQSVNWTGLIPIGASTGLALRSLVSGATLAVAGELLVNLSGHVLALGTFSLHRASASASFADVQRQVDLIRIEATSVTLFLGVGGRLHVSDGAASLVASEATGFKAENLSLSIGLARAPNEPGSPVQRWVGIAANASELSAVGLPADFAAVLKNLSLRYNASANAPALDWKSLPGAANGNLGLLGSETALSLSGDAEWNLGGAVIAAGVFGLEKSVRTQVNTGSASEDIDVLLLSISGLRLFLGTGGSLQPDGSINTSAALGFLASNARLVLAMAAASVRSPGDSRRWTAISASADAVGAVGLPDGYSMSATNVVVRYNGVAGTLDASPTQAIDWAAISPDPASPLSTLDAAAALSVVGTLDLSLKDFAVVRGSFGFAKSAQGELAIVGSNAVVSLNAGPGASVGIDATNVGIVATATGTFAMEATGAPRMSLGPELTASATSLSFKFNNTGVAVDRTISLVHGPVVLSQRIQVADGLVEASATGLVASIRDFVVVQGNVGFRKVGTEIVAVGTQVNATMSAGASASVSVTGATLGLKTGNGATVLEVRDGAFAAQVAGLASVTATAVRVQYSNAGGSAAQGETLTVGGTSYAFGTAIGANTVLFESTGLVVDVAGFVRVSGNVGFRKVGAEIVAVGTQVNATMSAGSSASVSLTGATLGLKTGNGATVLEVRDGVFAAQVAGLASVTATAVRVQYSNASGSAAQGETLTVGGTSFA
ncbi:MAG: YDG domain-containing protein, partial [Verrucomicrobiota bacterium]